MSKIPIVMCGRQAAIASHVRLVARVTHICLNPEKAVTEVPIILSGGIPPDHESNLGSQDYSNAPIAVTLGGGYKDEDFQAVMKAAEESSTARKVVWLRANLSVAGPPKPEECEAYGTKVAERLKEWLNKENLEEKRGGTFFF